VATNIKSKGSVLNLTMPYVRTSGQGVLVGGLFGVCLTDTASGAVGSVETHCVATLPKLTGTAWTQGARVFWDDTLKQVDTTNTSDFCIGYAAAAAASGDATGDVYVTPGRPIPAGT
jgi:predicted RecA/RadA family phage recombinase